jgi:hypothetical protein
MYISSADFMTRNTERRVEIAVPIMDAAIRTRIHRYLELCFADNTKARSMDNAGKYHHIHGDEPDNSSQDILMATTKGSVEAPTQGTIRPAHKGIIFSTTYKPEFPEVTREKKPKRKKASGTKKSEGKPKKKDSGKKTKTKAKGKTGKGKSKTGGSKKK